MSYSDSYLLRRFNPASLRDLETVELMESHPLLAYMPDYQTEQGEELSYREFLSYGTDLALTTDQTDINLLYAITDHDSHVVGLVWYYTDKEQGFPASFKDNPHFAPDTIYLQLSYYKLMSDGWSKRHLRSLRTVPLDFIRQPRRGVAVSGVKQSLALLRRQIKKLSFPHPIVVYAYNHPTNLASAAVLRRNRLILTPTLHLYADEPHQLWYKQLTPSSLVERGKTRPFSSLLG